MSVLTHLHHGIWDQPKEVPQPKNKGPLIAIGAIAILAIGALVAGGVLLNLKTNTIISWSLLGGGGGVLISEILIGGMIICIRGRRQPSTYRIVSWNVGTCRDYSNMCFLNKKMDEDDTLLEAYEKFSEGEPYHASEEELTARIGLFQRAFLQCGNPDIICLQESWEMKEKALESLVPEGYSAFSYENEIGRNCTIFWNTSKFSKVNHAHINYDPNYVQAFNNAPDTILLLKDNSNGTTICVGSAHLRGFSLAYGNYEEIRKKQELNRATAGDNQARHDLKTMDGVEADLYVFAGDFNATTELYPTRFDIIREYGYINDESDTDPTTYDGNVREDDDKTPKPVKLDHIFVKGKKRGKVKIKKVDLERTPIDSFDRPSDHLPVGAEVTYTPPSPYFF